MKPMLRNLLFAACVGAASQASAQVTFYAGDHFAGPSFSTNHTIADLIDRGYNDRASSAMVRSGSWEVCDDLEFRGRCVVLNPGDYPSLAAFGLRDRVSSIREVERSAGVSDRGDYREAATEPSLTLFEHDNFSGRSLSAERMIPNFARQDYNDIASSATVRGGSWEVCTHENFQGRCVILRPGDYPSLRELGLNDQISSAREMDRPNANIAERPFNGERVVSGASDRYDYRGDGWRYDRWTRQWERY